MQQNFKRHEEENSGTKARTDKESLVICVEYLRNSTYVVQQRKT